jgi:2-oxoglutarate dehydrogenase E2 component (dihydrolipoamide succinyltransferase)
LVTGTITKLLYQQNDVIKIGETIALIETDSQIKNTNKQQASKKETLKSSKPSSLKLDTKTQAIEFEVANPNLHFSPLIVSVAKEYHISFEELARIPVSGNEGRLRKSDLMNYIEEGRPFKYAQPKKSENKFKVPDLKFDKGKGKLVEMDRMRQIIADRMVFSKHTSPHVTAYVEADLTEMVNWRNRFKSNFLEKYQEKLTFTPLFVEAVASALLDFPMINSSLDGNNIIVKEEINIGMATALPSGNLIVPVVKNADKKTLKELAVSINSLSLKARKNKLKADDTSDSTFTISNVGTFGSVMGTPIINQPEAAILATGIIKKRAEVIERPAGDSIEIRQMMYLSLSFDHRIVDGFLAGSFLRRIADNLENFDSNRKI